MGSVAVQRILASLLLGGVALVAGLLAFVGMHAVDFSPVVARLYLQLDFAVTPLARPFLALLCIASLAVAIWDLKRGTPRAGIMLALFVAAMVGVLLARSAAAFLLCWELMSLLSIFLVAAESARRTVRRAAFAYALMSQLSALAIAVALATLALNAGSGSFARIALHAVALPATTRGIVIGTAFIGFGAKAGLVPLQFWLPRAHPAAPANASALLSGVMLEIALFGLTLLVFSFAAPLPLIAGVVLLVVGLAGVLLGGLYAAIESELKRLLAYSSIEHLGVMTAALGLAAIGGAIENPMLVAVALVAMLFHAINHAAFKSLLFLGAGTLIERLDHVTDLDRLRGLARTTLRRSAPWLLVGCLAACALPPSNGFISEWFVLHGFILALGLGVPWLVFVAAFALLVLLLGGGLAAAGFVKFVGVALLGEPRREHIAEIPERNDFAVLALGLLAAICLLFGFLPALVALPL
ncbi:MAG TPA: proton-conducting transporter membrane subunit, partial [Candidatus Dormibacteraeota bacterium]|nr:proton-conducting transporter membrane subunit [Candidatus Dormibacteraeota bacterium]